VTAPGACNAAKGTGIRQWRWERVTPPAQGQWRRQRQVFTVELHPGTWARRCLSAIAGGGMTEEYRAFHGDDHPVIWRVRFGVRSGTWEWVACYCDAHLPAEYRPAEQAEERAA
jgi:hypothetical protein